MKQGINKLSFLTTPVTDCVSQAGSLTAPYLSLCLCEIGITFGPSGCMGQF